MPNNLYDPRYAQPALQPPSQVPDLADAWTANTKMLTDYITSQRQQSVDMGLMDPATGLPTAKGLVAAAGQYSNALMMGTTAPGPAKVAPMDAFLDAVDEAHSKAGLDKISHINLFPHSANEAEISHIGVDAEHRGKGVGNQIMGMVTDAADQHGITLHASPASDADASTGLDYGGLRDWYDRWGFDQPGGGDRLTRAPGEPPVPGFTAYHGSPHSFDAFDTSKIGTGEGAQAYGHGLYFAGNEGVAQAYRKNLSGPSPDFTGAIAPDFLAALKADDYLGFDSAGQAISAMRAHPDWAARWDVQNPDALATGFAAHEAGKYAGQGSMYEVNIAADPQHFLDWDKPLYQQSEHVRGALESLGIKTEPRGQWTVKPTANGDKFTVFNVWGEPSGTFATEAAARAKADAGTASHNASGGMYAYSQLGGNPAYSSLDQGAASQKLRDAGIPGIRYLDQGSRAAGEGTSNHVVFDANTIEILRKYGIAGLGIGLGAAAAGGNQPQQ